MIEYVKIADIRPAEYNPRYLSDEAKARLLKSISELGLIKPIVLRRSDYRVIAGHQRSMCLKELGNIDVPCFFVDNVSSEDEVRFNQLHNRLEVEIASEQPKIKVNVDNIPFNQFVKIRVGEFKIINSGECGALIRGLSRLITRYGDFGSAVCDQDGNLIVSTVYALCSILLQRDLYVYRLNEQQTEYAKEVFSHSYGEFSYKNIKRETFVQTLAQMFRLSEGGGKQNMSSLYEQLVLPNVTKEMRILDFGAGRKAYPNALQKKGYNIKALEFFYRNKENKIDTKQVQADYNEIVKDISENGPFDAVVLDSVLNSVDSPEAEDAVLRTIQTLCKKNGLLFFSGRKIEKFEHTLKKTHSMGDHLYFFDKNGFTANLRSGHWFFQRGHSNEEIQMLSSYFGQCKKRYVSTYVFGIMAVNEKRPSILQNEDAITFEFTLPLPNGRYELDKPIIEALKKWDNQE